MLQHQEREQESLFDIIRFGILVHWVAELLWSCYGFTRIDQIKHSKSWTDQTKSLTM